MTTIEGYPEDDLRQLLTTTVHKYVQYDARIARIDATPLRANMSGARIYRCDTSFESADGTESTIPLVVKKAHLVERRVMTYLSEMEIPSVPFAYSPDTTTEGAAWTCMRYVGDEFRPTSLDPITDEYVRAESEALAAIHAMNLGKAEELRWLPRTTPQFFQDVIVNSWWRPNWERVLQNKDFVREFSPELKRVERAAETMPAEMSALVNEDNCLTLVHMDINPSNVLVFEGRPYYIDWPTAHYAPFYLDLPHHHATREHAETYRQAMTERGVVITKADFTDRYRAAAKYIALRYIWWTLENWEQDHNETAWVRHYTGLIHDD